MFVCEPEELNFSNVRLNQAYKSSLCITNTHSSSVEFSIRSTSPRYSISPNRARLDPGASIVVTVRLFVSQTNPAGDAASSIPKTDSLILKSLYSEQKISVSFLMFNKRDKSISSRSPSPSRRSVVNPTDGRGTPSRQEATDNFATHNTRSPPSYFNASPPRTKPNIPPRNNHDDDNLRYYGQTILDTGDDLVPRSELLELQKTMDQDKLMFEEKSEKVIRILQQKDDTIKHLRDQLQQTTPSKSFSGTTGTISKSERRHFSDDYVEDLERRSAEQVGLRERLLDQSEQIEVLISEVERLRLELDSVPVSDPPASQGFLSSEKHSVVELQNMIATLKKEASANQHRIVNLESDLSTSQLKLSDAEHEKEEIMRRINYLESENGDLQRQHQELNDRFYNLQAQITWNKASSPGSDGNQKRQFFEENGKSLLDLYQERASHAENENGLLRDHVLMVEKELANSESRCAEFLNKLREKDALYSELCEQYSKLESISNAYHVGRQPQNPDADVTKTSEDSEPLSNIDSEKPKSETVALDSEIGTDRSANVWWSYVWHSISSGDRQDGEALLDLAIQNTSADSERLQKIISSLKAALSTQAVEIATVKQVGTLIMIFDCLVLLRTLLNSSLRLLICFLYVLFRISSLID